MNQLNTGTSFTSFSTPAAEGSRAGQITSGGLRLVEVSDIALPEQQGSSANAGGLLSVFVVRGGINMGEEDADTNQR